MPWGVLLERNDRRKWTLGLGVALTLTFFVLRALNLYGNGEASSSSFLLSTVGPWKVQPSLTLTIIAFFDTLKYPPSLDYLLMTLGPALIVLACLDGVTPGRGLGRILLVFGRVPLFYYVLHILLIHAMAIFVGLLFHQPVFWLWHGGHPPPAGYGSRFAVCLLDVVYSVVDSLPPLQVVHGVQEQASRLRMVELPIGVLIEIWDEQINGRV